ncbi:hypothetical protein FJZ53_01340 [Candidatus Woesearchaeota archaeon]|nr:hypothetical protein [Candidatus Woesearchaeota archaeon]
MKKLKTLCAIVGTAAALYSGAAFAATQKYKVPNYSLDGAEKKVEYAAITLFGVMAIEDPSQAHGLPVLTVNKYFVDTNKDKKADIVQIDILVPDMDAGNGQVQKGYTVKQLYVDDDFNGSVDRMLTDSQDEKGQPGADGVYDEEQYSLRIDDLKASTKL